MIWTLPIADEWRIMNSKQSRFQINSSALVVVLYNWLCHRYRRGRSSRASEMSEIRKLLDYWSELTAIFSIRFVLMICCGKSWQWHWLNRQSSIRFLKRRLKFNSKFAVWKIAFRYISTRRMKTSHFFATTLDFKW